MLSQFAPDVVDVLVTLNPGIGFIDTGSGNHPDLAWSLDASIAPLVAADIALVEDGATKNWQWVFHGAVTTSDNLGTFGYSYLCSDALPNPNPTLLARCGNGASHPDPVPIEFRISKSGITPELFIANAGGHYFVADIINGQTGGNGLTGLVWTDASVVVNPNCTFNCLPSTVPEPATLALLGTGLAVAASRLRRKTGPQ